MKCQFLKKLEELKSKGKKVKIMNKVGYMLDHDRDELFFKYNPNLS